MPEDSREFVEILTDLRGRGWMVAVHNDYRQNGRFMTFWLFTKGNVAFKGEGPTDLCALRQVRDQVDLVK